MNGVHCQISSTSIAIFGWLVKNEKLLALWGGSSGASQLVYRWGTVHRIVVDIQEGLARAGA